MVCKIEKSSQIIVKLFKCRGNDDIATLSKPHLAIDNVSKFGGSSPIQVRFLRPAKSIIFKDAGISPRIPIPSNGVSSDPINLTWSQWDIFNYFKLCESNGNSLIELQSVRTSFSKEIGKAGSILRFLNPRRSSTRRFGGNGEPV
jgi:hypothetical protein